MWLFTPFGFFSIVAHWDDPELLLVRARARADLQTLGERFAIKLEVLHTPSNDYPYRAILPRELVAEVLRAFALEGLTYPNFKSEVARRQGYERAAAYHDVWASVHQIEDVEARRPAARVAAPRPQTARKRKRVRP